MKNKTLKKHREQIKTLLKANTDLRNENCKLIIINNNNEILIKQKSKEILDLNTQVYDLQDIVRGVKKLLKIEN